MADASSEPRSPGTRPVCGRTIRPPAVSSSGTSRAVPLGEDRRRCDADGLDGLEGTDRPLADDARNRLLGEHEDEPGPARRRGEMAVQYGLELRARSPAGGLLGDLQRQLAGRDEVTPGADDHDAVGCRQRRRHGGRGVGVVAHVEQGAGGERIDAAVGQAGGEREADDER